MSSYSVYFPSLLPGPPPRVALFMTWDDSCYLADGTLEFAREVMAAVGVHEPIEGFRFPRYRACYFTDDSSQQNWVDLWVPTWKLTVELVEPPRSLDVLHEEGRRGVVARDASWSTQNNPMDAKSGRCLVIGDFPDRDALERARAAVAELVPEAGFEVGDAFARFKQLHVDLGDKPDAWYQAGAADAVAVRELLEEHGASTFWNHTLPKTFQ